MTRKNRYFSKILLEIMTIIVNKIAISLNIKYKCSHHNYYDLFSDTEIENIPTNCKINSYFGQLICFKYVTFKVFIGSLEFIVFFSEIFFTFILYHTNIV